MMSINVMTFSFRLVKFCNEKSFFYFDKWTAIVNHHFKILCELINLKIFHLLLANKVRNQLL